MGASHKIGAMLTPALNVRPAQKQRKGGTAIGGSGVASWTADISLVGKATSLLDKALSDTEVD